MTFDFGLDFGLRALDFGFLEFGVWSLDLRKDWEVGSLERGAERGERGVGNGEWGVGVGTGDWRRGYLEFGIKLGLLTLEFGFWTLDFGVVLWISDFEVFFRE